jgi:Zn-dependent M16 (insulinase) family peptidase
MFNIIKQIIFDTDVQNEEQAKDIMQRLIDDMEDDIQTNGHKYTTLRIKSRYSLPGFVAEQWKGITQLMNLRRALAISQTDFDSVGKRLILMQDAMKRGNRNGMLLGVTGDHDAIKGIAYSIQIFVKDTLPPAAQVTRFPDFAKTAHPWVTKGLTSMEAEIQGEDPNEAFIVPTFVNHVGKGGILFDVGEALGGEDAVVMQFLGGYYLYDRVRFNLGASQAWAELDADSGVVVYQSDRDPNIVETLKVYEKGASWLWEQLNRKSELPIEAKSAVVGTIGTIDGTALQPSQAGYISMLQYLKQDKQAYRQKYRDEVLAAKPEDFIAMVERLGAWGKPSIVVVTNTDQYNIAQKKGYNMTTCDYADYSCKG